MKKLLLLFALLTSLGASANLIVIKTLAANGTGSLKQACEGATVGDTILINVAGTIQLNNPIVITTNNLTILGAYPAHTSITQTSGTQDIFEIQSCDDIKIAKIGFVSSTAETRALSFQACGGALQIEHCLFENFNLSGPDGGAIHISDSPVQVISCSFLNNSANNGGAIHVNSGSLQSLNNTFISNSADDSGGAISFNDNFTGSAIFHNTFYENSAAGEGDQVFTFGTNGSIILKLNASVPLGSSGQSQFFQSAAGNFVSEGGNKLDQGASSDSFDWFDIDPGQGDEFFGIIHGLHNTGLNGYVTDGFGLKYYTITESNSTFIDVNIDNAFSLIEPDEDCRRAPRELTGIGAFDPRADAGACEYTQLRVIFDSGNTDTQGELGWALTHTLNFDTQNYIEFDLPDASIPATITPIITGWNVGGYPVIVDGYSQEGSVIPGPKAPLLTGVSGGTQAITLAYGTASDIGVQISALAENSRISGMNFVGFPQFGVDANNCNGLKVQGCKFGINHLNVIIPNQDAGLRLIGAEDCVIGGSEHWQRNVFTGNGGASGSNECGLNLAAGSKDNIVLGNIFGLSTNGVDQLPVSPPQNNNGIVNSGEDNKIGSSGLLGRNVFGDLFGTAILESGSDGTLIQKNFIGTDYSGNLSRPCSTGVHLDVNAQNVTIGSQTVPGLKNIISGNWLGDIKITNAGNVGIHGNYIGLDSAGTAVVNATDKSIIIDGANVSNIQIGAPGVVTSRNYIAGSNSSISISNSSGDVEIFNNYIGTDITGISSFANQEYGIFIDAGAAPTNIGQASDGNLISGFTSNVGAGIRIAVGANNHTVSANIIGLDATGTAPLPNKTGIKVNGNTNTIGGLYSTFEGNTISGNTFYGIDISNLANANKVEGNRIGTGIFGSEAGLGNGSAGIKVFDATNTTIGGVTSRGNVISGHSDATDSGILLDGTGSGTIVSGNRIGTDFNGTSPIPNEEGITISNTHEAFIGGGVGNENYICANTNGVHSFSPNVIIDGNYVGVGIANSTLMMGNTTGIRIEASTNVIGGLAGRINVVSNNSGDGILIIGNSSDSNTINNCFAGLNPSGNPIGNGGNGIRIVSGDYNLIGNSMKNFVGGNTLDGINLDVGATFNEIVNNDINNVNGIAGTENSGNGIGIYSNSDLNVIGSLIFGGGNTFGTTVFGNSAMEINASDSNQVMGNFIGIDASSNSFINGVGIKMVSCEKNIIGRDWFGVGQKNVIANIQYQAILMDSDVDNCIIAGNSIGTNISGNTAAGVSNGIFMGNLADNNQIGGSTLLGLGNLLSGLLEYGVTIEGDGNLVQGNRIGVNETNNLSLGNALSGVFIEGGTNNIIGGDRFEFGNFIAGNGNSGILIQDGQNNIVEGNIIGGVSDNTQPRGIELKGLTTTGNQIGNSPAYKKGNYIYQNITSGISIEDQANNNDINNNRIGLDTNNAISMIIVQENGIEIMSNAGVNNIGNDQAGKTNIISGNEVGIYINGASNQNIYNNWIGLDTSGTAARANSSAGISIVNGGIDNEIGGDQANQGNVISGNDKGVFVTGAGTDANIIAGNTIGMDVPKLNAIQNQTGVLIEGAASGNHIGMTTGNGSNLISGNHIGIDIAETGTSNNLVLNNEIGGDFPNVFGVVISDNASANVIGGNLAQRNVISGNDSVGVGLQNCSQNVIEGNLIGLESDGVTANPNLIGVFLDNATQNQIGNSGSDEGNVISGNTLYGLVLDIGSDNNTIYNNFIGTDESGNASSAALGNNIGMLLYGASDNKIGDEWTSNEGNVICSNSTLGVLIDSSFNNVINGNNIGLSKNNNVYLGNTADGIRIRNNSGGNLIGTTISGEKNVITANGSAGIRIKNSFSNVIKGNLIGNDDLGGTGSVSGGTNFQEYGIILDTGAVDNIVDELNILSGNTNYNIGLTGPGCTLNKVEGNYIGVDNTGVTAYPGADLNMSISAGASSNTIGGINPNIFGGDVSEHIKIFGTGTDSNIVINNNINIGSNDVLTFNSDVGIYILSNSMNNVIGGGGTSDANYFGGLNEDAIRIQGSNNNKVIGNSIGIDPASNDSPILGSGVKLLNSDNTFIGTSTVGSDSSNVITNCHSGVAIETFGLSSYGNFIVGNSIYENDAQGIDIDGDNLILANDTSNANLNNNGHIDHPLILEAWTCLDGNTHVGLETYLDPGNVVFMYTIELYSNVDLDPSLYGEGQTFLGQWIYDPQTSVDTFAIDLGTSLPVGTVITATITGVLGNTSEFSKQFAVTASPIYNTPTATPETCFGADDGEIAIFAPGAHYFTTNVLTDTTYGVNGDTLLRPADTYVVDAIYLNGCALSQTVVLDPGPDLPFNYTIVDDTCGNGFGSIVIDTAITNLNGGSANYGYTFSDGSYLGSIDTTNLLAGIYNVQLEDQTLGCYSMLVPITIGDITDLVDESFDFDDFCPGNSALPYNVAEPGGAWFVSGGAGYSTTTGEITSSTPGQSYTVSYTVGFCNEVHTVTVTANFDDDNSLSYDDICEEGVPNIVTGFVGGVWSINPTSGDIDPVTGQIGGIPGSYQVTYTTNGSCPADSTVTVQVLSKPSAPSIILTDSIYCPGEALAALSVTAVTGETYFWYDDPSLSTSVAMAIDYSPPTLSPGDNYFFVTSSGANGCVSEADSANYELSDFSGMGVGDDFGTCLASQIELSAFGGVSYAWSASAQITGDLTDSLTGANITMAEDFYVEITDDNGCTYRDTLSVTLLSSDSCYVETYNAFSPNNDGTNDLWLIDGIEGFPENQVYLYNRWGDVLVKFINYNNSDIVWDGTKENGKKVPAGTYFYVVNVGGSQNQAGWIQVVE